jgi:hypothetical protein
MPTAKVSTPLPSSAAVIAAAFAAVQDEVPKAAYNPDAALITLIQQDVEPGRGTMPHLALSFLAGRPE